MTKIQQIQTILGVSADGVWGPIAQAALDKEKSGYDFKATRVQVKNRGIPPFSFLTELVNWAKQASDDIFAVNNEPNDVFSSVERILGRSSFIRERKAVMLEVLRVLGGFESSWNWEEGVDTTNSTSITDETKEAGLWQVSYNSRAFGQDLKSMLLKAGISNGKAFQSKMKRDHVFAIEYTARLIRHTTQHHGPLKRGEIHLWLSTNAVKEFYDFI